MTYATSCVKAAPTSPTALRRSEAPCSVLGSLPPPQVHSPASRDLFQVGPSLVHRDHLRAGGTPRGEGNHTWALGAWPQTSLRLAGASACTVVLLWQGPSPLAGTFLLKWSHPICGFLGRLSWCVCSRSCFLVPGKHFPSASPRLALFSLRKASESREFNSSSWQRECGEGTRASSQPDTQKSSKCQPESEGQWCPWGTGTGTGGQNQEALVSGADWTSQLAFISGPVPSPVNYRDHTHIRRQR